MRWPWSKPVAPSQPAFVCLQHHPVTICFTADLIHNAGGGELQTVTDAAMHKHINWHNERFQRDDIADPELLRKTTNILHREQVRRYFTVDNCRLESFDGKVLVVTNEGSNGFFVGFAATLMDAMHYVATGDDKQLVKPW